jgi:hypothetical protein
MADPRVIDLDAARAARAETTAPVVVRLGGEDFELPNELPLEAAMSADDPVAFLTALLGNRADEFMAAGPSIADVATLAESIASVYGFESPGESVASGS